MAFTGTATLSYEAFMLTVLPRPDLPSPEVWSLKSPIDSRLWEGVTRDSRSGHVIIFVDGGTNVDDSTTFFLLRHLHSLACDKMCDSVVPSGFENLSSLTCPLRGEMVVGTFL
ncbi:hypothetical protein LINPERPRIM_LOCUS36210 [Linum perenne]